MNEHKKRDHTMRIPGLWTRQVLRIGLPAALGLLLGFGGCDRYVDDTPNENQPPTAWFVNFPEDSTQFSYAPTVHWQGHDPDGFVTDFEYYDDTTAAAIAAYHASEAEWMAYVNSLPASVWISTPSASRRIYLLTEAGQVAEHIFMIRAVDNLGSRSPVVVRTFFRSNRPPNPPRIRWAGAVTTTYHVETSIPDTLLMGDTLTVTYGGIRLLWQGSDPDSRSNNIIPLEFSYLLVKLPSDTVPLPVIGDSNRVVGYRAGWSNWSDATQISLSGLETGNHTFFVRVRDDGLTLSDTLAKLHFYDIKPTFHRRLLIVDENKAPSAADLALGGIHSDTIMQFYRGADGLGGVVREAFEVAEVIRPFVNPPTVDPIEPFVYDDSPDGPVMWYDNRNQLPIPRSLIAQFKSVWVIDDDDPLPRTSDAVPPWTNVLEDYLNVGGTFLWTGRRIFNESLGIAPAAAASQFLRSYFGIVTVRAKTRFSSAQPAASGVRDFGGAAAGDPQYPDLEIDPAMIGRLRYFNQPVTCPPEIEYFGRSASQQSFDFAQTVYNYVSCTAGEPSDTSNVDCNVDEANSDTMVVVLIPADETKPLLSVSRIRNVTRNVNADFMYVRNISLSSLTAQWRIFASIPTNAGAWTDGDVLEVDYAYIPLSEDHDEPVAVNFVKYDGTTEIEIDGSRIRVRVTAVPRFRTSLFTFPFSYMKNEPYNHPVFGPIPAVSLVIANQLLFFNQNLDVDFNSF